MKQQKQHRSPEGGLEPYVGAIVSPNRSLAAGSQAEIGFFCTDYPKDKDIPLDADPVAEGCLPMRLEVSSALGTSISLAKWLAKWQIPR